jgi:hypothetical protein
LCKDPEVQELWKTSVENLDTWLQEQHTDQDLWEFLIDNLLGWYYGNPTTNTPEALDSLLKQQTEIGWQY